MKKGPDGYLSDSAGEKLNLFPKELRPEGRAQTALQKCKKEALEQFQKNAAFFFTAQQQEAKTKLTTPKRSSSHEGKPH